MLWILYLLPRPRVSTLLGKCKAFNGLLFREHDCRQLMCRREAGTFTNFSESSNARPTLVYSAAKTGNCQLQPATWWAPTNGLANSNKAILQCTGKHGQWIWCSWANKSSLNCISHSFHSDYPEVPLVLAISPSVEEQRSQNCSCCRLLHQALHLSLLQEGLSFQCQAL